MLEAVLLKKWFMLCVFRAVPMLKNTYLKGLQLELIIQMNYSD